MRSEKDNRVHTTSLLNSETNSSSSNKTRSVFHIRVHTSLHED